jgi:ferredoxin-nitrite reductase
MSIKDRIDMSETQLPEPLQNAGFSPEQKEYLAGLFAGVAVRGTKFSDVEPTPGKATQAEELIFEERVKRELHPLDAYEQIIQNAESNKLPDKEEVFRFKWNGLFFLAPVKNAFMARLRIPGGLLRSYQLRELAKVAAELTSGYVQITTRANLQMRLIEPKDAPDFLHRIQSVGLHTRGAGADNIRNLTANPTSGIDPVELIDVMPYILALGQIIINDRSFYDLPRKFNIAYDGGGLIGAVEDTNDVGAKAVKVGDRVMFRIALGGATGHKSFARDLGVIVAPSEINKVVAAIVRIYIEKGNRTDRKKARLKHLLEKMSLADYLQLVETKIGKTLERSPYDPGSMRWESQELPHSHVGVYPQKQPGLNYIGISLPVGQITSKQMAKLAELSEQYGSGDVRLTVWQNLILPNVPDASVKEVCKAIDKAGLGTKQSNVASGIIACTGNSYCKFAQSNTKGHALELTRYLEKHVELDQPVNIHFTGCPNSCAQHYMGDIGLLGTKAKIAGESVDGYHVFVGGGFGKNQSVGRQVFTGIAATEISKLVEGMLKAYLKLRQAGETFQQFTTRHDLNQLQVFFTPQ